MKSWCTFKEKELGEFEHYSYYIYVYVLWMQYDLTLCNFPESWLANLCWKDAKAKSVAYRYNSHWALVFSYILSFQIFFLTFKYIEFKKKKTTEIWFSYCEITVCILQEENKQLWTLSWNSLYILIFVSKW